METFSSNNPEPTSIEIKRQKQKLKKKQARWQNANILLPLLSGNGIENNIVNSDDTDGDDDDVDDYDKEAESKRRKHSKNRCYQVVVYFFKRMLGRKQHPFKTDNDIEDDDDENAHCKLKRFSERLDGVNCMLNEKICHVQRKLESLHEKCNSLVDRLIIEDGASTKPRSITKIDLVSVLKEIDVYSRQYDFFSNIRVNLIKLHANTDVHGFSDTVKEALSLIPSNMKKIKAEKEFCLATRYSDALDDFAQRMELPLSTVELERVDLEESYEAKMQNLLKEREMLKSSQISNFPHGRSVPRREIQPSINRLSSWHSSSYELARAVKYR